MIDPTYVRTMARYNRWQNGNLYAAADALSDEARRQDRGAFFKSILGTLNHLLWADEMWMSRLSDGAPPSARIAESPSYVEDWEMLKQKREVCDERIVVWADALEPAALSAELTWWSGILQTDMTKPRWFAITHMFNHQTHHRGQAHALLTAAGAKPHATDLMFIPA